MDAVQRDLNLLLTPDQIDNGGLFIYTTLDPLMQKAATDAIEKQLARDRAAVRVQTSAQIAISSSGRGRRQCDAISGRRAGGDR